MPHPTLRTPEPYNHRKEIRRSIIRFLDVLGYGIVFYAIINCIVPVYSHSYIIENSAHQTVMFEGTFHISTPEYYSNIGKDIADHTPPGPTVYIEGVKDAEPKMAHAFQDTPPSPPKENINDIYNQFAERSGLILQDYDRILAPVQHLSPTIKDVDIVQKNIQKIIDHKTDQMSSHPLSILGWNPPPTIMRAIIRLSINQPFSFSDHKKTDNQDPIIGQRNTLIVQDILAHHPQHSVVIYGDDHWNNFFHQMQQHDPTWHIVYAATHKGF